MVLIGNGQASIDGIEEELAVLDIVKQDVSAFFGQIRSGEITQEQGLALIEKALLALKDSDYANAYLASIEITREEGVELYDAMVA